MRKALPPYYLHPIVALFSMALTPAAVWATCATTVSGTDVGYACSGTQTSSINAAYTNSQIQINAPTGLALNNYSIKIDGSNNSEVSFTGNNITNTSGGTAFYQGIVHLISGNGKNASITVNDSTIYNGSWMAGLVAQANGSGDATVTTHNTNIQFLNAGYSFSAALQATSGSGHASIDMTGGSVDTQGDYVYGLYAKSTSGNVTVDASGDITTRGYAGHGIYAQTSGTGNIEVTSSGDITTLHTGSTVYGIYALNNGNGTTHVTTSSDITTGAGMYSHGVFATASGNGNVQIDYQAKADNSLGTVTTSSNGAYALSAQTTSSQSAAVGINASGQFQTAGYDATGLRAWNASTNGGDVTVNFNAGSIRTTGTEADGILAVMEHGQGNISITAAGTIDTLTTSGAGAHGIVGQQYNSANTGNIAITYTGQHINTNAASSYAIQAIQVGSGQTRINNTGALTTLGNYSHGILSESATGSAYLHSQGTVETSGLGAIGIYGKSTGGDVIISAGGHITTHNTTVDIGNSLRPHGIYGTSQNNGNVRIEYDDSDGAIQIAAGSTDDHNIVAGIRADSNGAGNASITVHDVGEIRMTNSGTAALAVRTDSAATGDISIDFRHGNLINDGAGNADGISAENYGTGDIYIRSLGNIAVYGNAGTCGAALCGSEAIYAAGNADVTVLAGGTIRAYGTDANDSSGIVAYTGSNGGHTASVIFDDINGTVGTTAQGSVAIRALAALSGDAAIQINQAQAIFTTGSNAAAILAETRGAGTASTLINGHINTSGDYSDGVYSTSASGDAYATITGGSVLTSGSNADGVLVSAGNNAYAANYTTIQTSGNAARGIIVNAPNGLASIENYGTVNASSLALLINAADNGTILNQGAVSALDDYAIHGAANTTLTVNNPGSLTGIATFSTAAVTLNNTGIWNLRRVADTDNDQTRDTLSVAISDFGSSGQNSINNQGTIALTGDNGQAITLNNVGEFSTGYTTNTMALNGGPVQAQILNVQTFTNSGTIDMGPSNAAVGDVLIISGGATPGVSGGGTYIANGGQLMLDTVLNEGGSNSQSDMLIVDGTQLGNAPTTIQVVHTGGAGAQTVGDGIELVRVLDSNQSAAGVFTLGNRLVAGAFDYDLYQGGVGTNTGNGNWYLRSAVRAETGVYLRNLSAASTMFMHTLHDRLGEPQFTNAYKDGGNAPSVWVRVVANNTESQAADGQVNLDTDTTLVQLGGDLARWSSNGSDRMHIGLMGAYGRSETDADAKNLYTPSGYKRTASGSVDGYSAGAYFTWYGNSDQASGPYVDTWAQYAWYDNKVQGNGQKEESYDSTGWTVSVEGGYAFIAGETENRLWMIEPQAQIAYNRYSADDHIEANGTWVRNGDADGVIARLGARFYSRGKLNDHAIQPFVETNWWYNSAKNSLRFNGTELSEDTPDNRFELKAGLQGEIAKGWQAWGHIGGQWGENSYSRYEGMIGVKHTF